MANPATVAALLLERASELSTLYPVAMPDRPFQKPDDGKYLRVTLFNNAPMWQGLTSGKMDQGLLQITLVWPPNEGVVVQREVAGQVMGHFYKGLTLYGAGARVKISSEPYAGSPILDDGESLTAITIPWRA